MQARRDGLLATIRERLVREKGNLRNIAEKSGVPYPTLTKITSGAVEDPRISTIQSLYDYFEGIPADSSKSGDDVH